MDTLYIVIPAYNEEANIKNVVEAWYPIVVEHNGNGKSRLLIIDDGSKDNTYSILKELSKDKELLMPLSKGNQGHGATVLYGYKYALDNNVDYIFQTDSDGQTLPEEFEEFWNNRAKYDMVIGHRKARKDGISRIVVTKILRLVIRLCFGVDVKDANTPFRLLKAETLKKYIELIPEEHNLANVILSVIYKKKKCTVKYIPITFRPRQGGINSINLRKIIVIGKKAIRDFIKINKKLNSE